MRFRTIEFKAVSLDDLGENEFAGYAAVFGNVDSYGDIIQRGAFAATLPSFLESGILCWQHQLRQPIGKPVAAYEDEKGLFIRGKISDTQQGRDALTLIRDQVVRRLSIGYETEGYQSLSEQQARQILGDAGFEKARDELPRWVDGLRLLTQIKLYEVSPVSIAANDQADILGVKSGPRMPETEREFERFLREVGFSRKQATALTAGGWKALQRDAGSEADISTLAAKIRETAAALTAS